MDAYRYILRYYIDNAFHTEDRIEELAHFCKQAQIEEVMLFLTPEELSPGHPIDSEFESHIEMVLRIKKRLGSQGMDISLNPWTTLYQVPRGRALRSGQNFRLMVGETGAQSPIVACPLCPQWQEWISSRFARLARETHPVAIWIEDDWRLHNHGGELGWGGCFCDEHIRLFSEHVGQKVTREQLLMLALQAGEPHPWREAWFSLSRETILQPLNHLCNAIREASPRTAAALMCSMPDQHSAEGRDWQKIKDAIGGGREFLLRPHMPPYTQTRALRNTPAILRQTLASLPADIPGSAATTGIYPELENSPRCGVFSKSGRYTIWQLTEAALFGSKGITLNHFDMMGNGIALDRSFADHLGEAKAKLSALRALKISDRNAEGAQMLFSTKIASLIRLSENPKVFPEKLGSLSMSLQDPSQQAADSSSIITLQQLVHNSVSWAETCSILGISQRFTTKVEPEKGPVFVCGQTLRAFTDAQIEQLLTGTLVLDAESVLVLLERSFGEAIGIQSAQWRSLETTPYGYESINEPDGSLYHGVANPRMSAQRCANRVLDMIVAEHARIRSTIHSPLHEVLWPATVDVATPQGGRALSTCYPLGTGQFYMGYFNVFRAAFLQQLLAETRDWPWAMTTDGLRCQRTRLNDGTLFAILNPTDDPFTAVTFTTSIDADSEKSQWLYLQEDGNWQPVTPQSIPEKNGQRHTFSIRTNSLDSVFLLRK